MKMFRVELAGVLASLLVACFPPTTIHPIGASTGLKQDPLLVGLWRTTSTKPDDPGAYFHFLPRHDGTISLVFVSAGNKPDANWISMELTTAKIGPNHFINTLFVSQNGKPNKDSSHETIPLLYRFDPKGRMLLFLMDEGATSAAIKAGKLKGMFKRNDYDNAVITADAKALDAFMSTPAGTALFAGKPYFTLQKLD